MNKMEENPIEFFIQPDMKGNREEKKKQAMSSPVPKKVQSTEAHGYANDRKGINVTSQQDNYWEGSDLPIEPEVVDKINNSSNSDSEDTVSSWVSVEQTQDELSNELGQPANKVIVDQLSELLNLRYQSIRENKNDLLSRFGVKEDQRYFKMMKKLPQQQSAQAV